MTQLNKSNYDKFPIIKINGHTCIEGWKDIAGKLKNACDKLSNKKVVIAIECYPGVYTNEIKEAFLQYIPEAILFDASAALMPGDAIEKMVYPYVTDDPVFGYMSSLNLSDFFDAEKIASIKYKLNTVNEPTSM